MKTFKFSRRRRIIKCIYKINSLEMSGLLQHQRRGEPRLASSWSIMQIFQDCRNFLLVLHFTFCHPESSTVSISALIQFYKALPHPSYLLLLNLHEIAINRVLWLISGATGVRKKKTFLWHDKIKIVKS